ncbi:MAG: hypothetical protein COA38_14445 [Fluviicola sp.]|nr:MAG: hypothetical protein COA38_14445 [Fluviicola sp.]
MSQDEIKVRIDSQNREEDAWRALLEFINQCDKDSAELFHPSQQFQLDHWVHIRTLPKEIGKLKSIKHLMIYGSNLTRLPQEIGQLEALEKFTPYTSYGLRWFPYEITRCSNLKDCTVSTRALFGNYKNKKGFPNLNDNPVDYFGGNKCSICDTNENDIRFEQYWVSCQVATDVLPLLVIVCSDECFHKIKEPASGYSIVPHKGGNAIKR